MVLSKSKTWLLIKNTLKDAWKLKAQLIGLIILLVLCGFIVTTVSISTNRLFQNYNQLKSESRLHDFVSDFNNINIKTSIAPVPKSKFGYGFGGAYSNNEERYKQEVFWKLATDQKLGYHPGSTPIFDYNRIESRNLSLDNNITIKVLGYNPEQQVDKLVITKGQGLSSEIVTPSPSPKQLAAAKNARGVILSQKFAELNNINIGDTIRLQPDVYGSTLLVASNPKLTIFKQANVKNNFNNFNNIMNTQYPGFSWFQVRGFGVSANMISPIINPTIGLANQQSLGITYINNSNFGLISSDQKTPSAIRAGPQHTLWTYDANLDRVPSYSGDQEVTYVGKFNANFYEANPGDTNLQQAVALINKQLTAGVQIKDGNQNLVLNFQNQSLKTNDIVYPLGDKNYLYNNRTALLKISLQTYNIICYLLLLFIIIVTVVATLLITQKRIEHARQQLGVLKASGYSKISLMIPFLVYPILTCLIGGTLGFIGGIGLQSIPISFFYRYFNLLPTSFIFDWKSWFFSIILSFVIIGLETLILSFLMLRNRPIELLVNHNVFNTTSSGLGRVLKKLSAGTSFKNRIKVSMFTSSLGKMTTIFLTMFAGTVIMSFALIGPKIINDNLNRFFYGDNYQNAVFYHSPDWNVPTTFMKTYDPSLQPWPYPNKSSNNNETSDVFPNATKLVPKLKQGEINPQYYAYNPYISSEDLQFYNLQNLTYRLFNLSYFKNNILKSTPNPLSAVILYSSWPDFATLVNNLNNISILKNQPIIYYNPGKLIWPKKTDKDEINAIYNALVRFYRVYYNTLLMSINPAYLTSTSTITNPFADNLTVVWENSGPQANGYLSKQNTKNFVLTSDGSKPVRSLSFRIFNHMLNSINFSQSNPLKLNETQYILEHQSATTISDLQTKINLSQDMAQWFNVTFANRTYTGVLQGIYSRAPYYIRQKFLKGFEDNQQFNLGFNIVPYNPKSDYLGTYVPATINNTAVKLMGLTPNQNMVRLRDNQGKNLNQFLFNQQQSQQGSIPVIVNEAAAIKMGLKVNQNIQAQTFFSQINGYFKPSPPSSGIAAADEKHWPKYTPTTTGSQLAKDWSMKTGGPSQGYLQQTMFYQNLLYQSIHPFESNVDPLSLAMGPSPVANSVQQHTTTLNNESQTTNLRIVGIYPGFGMPRAYISNQNAMHLMHYDLSKAVLFKLFLANWTKNNTAAIKDITNNAIFKEIQNYQGKPYKDFVAALDKNKNPKAPIVQVNDLFQALNPIFNYKLTSNRTTVDINQNYTVSDFYGDYTTIALNGGYYSKTKTDYTRTGTAALSLVDNKELLTETLLSLSVIANIVFILFSLISFLISLIIISLATSLVISENEYYINSLKIMGYTNLEILKIVTGMYIPLIVTAFAAGFPLSWFVLEKILHTVAMNSSWAFPLLFAWWLPVIVGGVIFGIYLVTYFLAWLRLKKTRMLDVVDPSK